MTRGIAAVNDVLFRELDRLEAVDPANAEAMKVEISRAKAVEGVAGKVIENSRLVLDVCKASTAADEAVRVPKGLIGA